MRFPGFIGPSYTFQSVNVDCQRSVNLYVEMNELGTGKEREVAALVPTPGLRLLCTLPQGPVRGAWKASNGTLYAVGGSKLYSVSSSWVPTEIGTLNTNLGPVSLADNGLELLMVDGVYRYAFTIATGTFQVIAGTPAADLVTFQDGYFLCNRSGTEEFDWSDLRSDNFAALDFTSAEGSPDLLVGLVSANQNVYLFGTQSTEVFYDSGDAASTFQRIQGAVSGVGCSAPHTIVNVQGSPFWLGTDATGSGIVYRMQGYQPQRISTGIIESLIRGLDQTTLSTARAWTYQQGGHVFYCLNLPGVNSTFCFDTATNFWHERTYLDAWQSTRHKADCHALAYGLNVVGDYQNGNLYALDPESYTDNGISIERSRTAPHMTQGLDRVFHSHFQLDMETGVGLDGSGNGTDPQAILSWSDDGGHSWSNERYADIGKIGRTRQRVRWNRLGSSRDRVYKVKITDPVKVVLIGADLGVEEGQS